MMEEATSPTDISSSLSEFVRKEKLLKELYQESTKATKPFEAESLKHNDEEIDCILQQMGKLLSPDGEESDNSVYKHVIEETENKSIEQILKEAKELVRDSNPLRENISSYLNIDDLSSECTENSITFNNLKDNANRQTDVNGNNNVEKNYDGNEFKIIRLNSTNRLNNSKNFFQGDVISTTNLPHKKMKSSVVLQNVVSPKKNIKEDKHYTDENQFLKQEVDRFNHLYAAAEKECENLKKQVSHLQNKWQEREQQLIEESQKLKKELSSISIQRVEILQTKLNTANEMINRLNDNLKKAADEWKKRETKLVEECNHLKYQIQSTPKTISPDVERLQEQLKDAQEMNLKLKFDYDSYKDKCTALEHLCGDLKKVIMDEHIAEKLYANDNIPATVKQFLSSSSSSVINTLSHVFGCLSKSSSKNRFHSAQRDGSLRRELFTTNESLMINDLSRNYEQNEIIKELIKEKEQLKKENMDLNRQVKELEQIVRRRAHPNFSHVSEIMKGNNESKQHEQESEIVKNLKKELLDKQYLVIDLKNQLVELKAKHDQSLLNLQGKVVNIQEESIKLKEELDKKKNVVVVTHGPKCKRRGRTCDPPTPSARNFRTELTAKDREIQTLNKQLEELKKTNRKLAKEKGQCVSYLSSKEQSADDIHTSRKQASGINSEIGSPDKAFTDFLKNSNFEIQKNYNGVDSDKYQNLRNIDDTNKMKMVSFDNNKNDLVKPVQNPSETASLGHNNANDYKVLSDKLNYLEGKHQNLQQITCNLLTLLTKEKQPGKEIDSLQHHEELHQFVTMLKDFSV